MFLCLKEIKYKVIIIIIIIKAIKIKINRRYKYVDFYEGDINGKDERRKF